MHRSRIASVVTLAASIACAGAPKPKLFGTTADLTPSVEVVGTDRLPAHLRITQPRSAYVTAFYVVPGEGTQLLFPTDSSGSKMMPAGTQEVATAFSIRPTNDTSRLLRRPSRGQPTGSGNQGGQGGRGGGAGGFQDSFVLVYAAQDSLAFKTLNERVIGVSLPGYNDEAFNTVTKLIRAAATGNGPWSAIAIPSRP